MNSSERELPNLPLLCEKPIEYIGYSRDSNDGPNDSPVVLLELEEGWYARTRGHTAHIHA